jgi:hypothetical protein
VSRWYLEVPNEIELAEMILGGHTVHNQLPPTGMHAGIDMSKLVVLEGEIPGGVITVTPIYVEGAVPPGTEDDWWLGSVADLVIPLGGPETEAVQRLLAAIANLTGRVLSDVLGIPLLKKGTVHGVMKWIRTTYRGILGGGVEQFQFHLDLGNPGNDPDLDEAGCLALATQLAGTFPDDAAGLMNAITNEAVFTELGCVMMSATAATDKDGKGGNMAQSFPTQWFMWPAGTGPHGIEGSPSLPYEVATAVSLQTDYRGPSGRGRLYLPPPAVQGVGAGGILNATHVGGALGGVLAVINAIKANTPYVALVVSPRRLFLHTITSINVGRVPDSQRRRRRSQSEARTVAPIV